MSEMKIEFEKGKSSNSDFYMLLFEIDDRMSTFVYLTPDESKELSELLKEKGF